jgi:hypothetical protein
MKYKEKMMSKRSTIEKIIKESYSEEVFNNGNFMEPMDCYIGFINPEIDEDEVANDETVLTAESIKELEDLYEVFCKENGFPTDTVEYVEMCPAEDMED